MNRGETSASGDMADKDLDLILAEANSELLGHIESAADSTSVLSAIMARTMPPAAPDSDTCQALAALVIGIRSGIRNLDHALDSFHDFAPIIDLASGRSSADELALQSTYVRGPAHALARVLARAPVSNLVRSIADDLARARAIAGDLGGDLSHAHELASELAHDLARAIAGDRALTRELDRVHELDRALELDRDRALDRFRDVACGRAVTLTFHLVEALRRVHDRTLGLAGIVGAQEVDASNADLSNVVIGHLDDLEGVIWTSQTIWPVGVADQVRVRSREIQSGVYQVTRGSDSGSFDRILV